MHRDKATSLRYLLFSEGPQLYRCKDESDFILQFHPLFFSCIALTIFSGVIGRSRILTPTAS